MKKLLFAFVGLLMLASCDSGTRDRLRAEAAEKATDAITPAVVSTLECEAVDVVRADVHEKVSDLIGVEDDKKMLGTLCRSVVATVVPQLVDAAIPARWECSATDVQDAASMIAGSACDKLD